MEVVICYCLECEHELGQFRNSWNVIGNNYYSPVYAILTYDNGFVGTGLVRAATLGSQDTCFLQDLACKNCQTYLGIRCDSAPEGHILKKNQLLLRLSKISSILEGTDKEANISVVNTFILEAERVTKKSKSRASTAQLLARPKSQSIQPANSRHQSTNGFMMPPPAKPPAPNLSRFEVWAETAINRQQKDIDRISGAVERIERTIYSFKDFMEEVQNERRANASSEQMKSIIGGFDSVRQQAVSTTKMDPTPLDTTTKTFHKDLDKLVEDTSQISQRAKEINGMKAELEQLKAKLRDLEFSTARKDVPIRRSLDGSEAHINLISTHDANSFHGKQSVFRVEISPLKKTQEVEAVVHDRSTLFSSPGDSSNNKERVSEFQPKRKRGANEYPHEADSMEYPSPLELPAKRRRVSDRATKNTSSANARSDSGNSDLHLQPLEPQAVEILPSQHGTSPIPGEDNEYNAFNSPQDVEHSSSLPPNKPHTAIAALEQTASRLRSSLIPPSISKSSAGPSSTPIPLLEQTPILGNRTRGLEISYGRPRDSNGNLLLPNGEPDKRSLRQKKSSLGNKENEMPLRSSMAADELQTSDTIQVPTKSLNRLKSPPPVPAPKNASSTQTVNRATEGEAIFQSIEADDTAPISDPRLASIPDSHIPTPEKQKKPFGCGVCSKRFATLAGLKGHKYYSIPCKEDSTNDEIPSEFVCSGCEGKFGTIIRFNRHRCESYRNNDGIVGGNGSKAGTEIAIADTEEAGRRVMAAREKLVKETMEREMGVGMIRVGGLRTGCARKSRNGT